METPGAIIFLNSNISEQVLSVTKNQLYTHQTIDLNTFNSDVNNYINLKLQKNERILVLINDFTNHQSRDEADVVIYISFGLAYILKNNFGPPGLCFQVDKLYLQKLLQNS